MCVCYVCVFGGVQIWALAKLSRRPLEVCDTSRRLYWTLGSSACHRGGTKRAGLVQLAARMHIAEMVRSQRRGIAATAMGARTSVARA